MLSNVRGVPQLTLQLPGRGPVSGVYFAFVSNASPWTYANARPIWTNPDTRFETGLGLFAITSMNVLSNLLVVRQMWSKKPRLRGKHLIRDDDLAWVRITAAEPIACQVDGDFLGARTEMIFTAVPDALDVIAPIPG